MNLLCGLDFPESEANQGSLNEDVMFAMNESIYQNSPYDSTSSGNLTVYNSGQLLRKQ